MNFQVEKHSSISVMQFTDRKLVIVSGLISFFLITLPQDIAHRIIELPDWNVAIALPRLSQVVFLLFLSYGVFWIIGSLLGLRALARNENLQAQLAKQWVFQQPLLVEIIIFVEHGIMAMLYILLTGDEKRGAILASLLVIHVIVALLVAPGIAKKASDQP